MKSVGSTTWIYLFQRFRVPGLRPYVALNRPEQTMPPPPMEGGKGQAEVLAEVVDAPVFHVNNRFGSEWTIWSHDSSHEVANRGAIQLEKNHHENHHEKTLHQKVTIKLEGNVLIYLRH